MSNILLIFINHKIFPKSYKQKYTVDWKIDNLEYYIFLFSKTSFTLCIKKMNNIY